MSLINCTQPCASEVLACARAISAYDLKTLLQTTGLQFKYPVSDNITHLQTPLSAYSTNTVAKVPILAGSNFNDGSTFAHGLNNFTAFLSTLSLPATAVTAVTKLYSPGAPAVTGLTTDHQIISKLITDSTFLCPASFLTNITTTYVKTPAWLYLFNATFANTQHPKKYPHLGVYHSSEIPLAFGTYPHVGATEEEVNLSKEEVNLSKEMQRA